MSMVDGLLAQLKLRGLAVEYVGDDQLKLVGPKGEATPEVVAAVKAFKKDLLAKFRPRDYAGAGPDAHHPPPPKTDDGPETCIECRSHVWDPEETATICEVRHCPLKRDRHG